MSALGKYPEQDQENEPVTTNADVFFFNKNDRNSHCFKNVTRQKVTEILGTEHITNI